MIKLALGFVCATICFSTLDARDSRTPNGPGHVSSDSSLKKIKKPRSVDSRGKKHGDFTMLGTGKDHSVILSNNVMYEPAHKHDAKIAENWQTGNRIRVLQTTDKKRFILLNLDVGTSMKAKILHWS